jgi:hypothetical protein
VYRRPRGGFESRRGPIGGSPSEPRGEEGVARPKPWGARPEALMDAGVRLPRVPPWLGHGGHLVAEDLTPGRERLVGGDDQAGPLAACHQLEDQVGRLGVERVIAHLVVDDERGQLASCPASRAHCE